MTYYPVMITTLNRYEHFKRCVKSLSECTHAEETELIIGLDYPPSDKYREGYLKIREFVKNISGFRKVTVFERETNLGPSGNFNALRDYVLQNHDAYISTEDDNEFSPCFLEYVNKAIEKYRDDSKVLAISAYTPNTLKGVSEQSSYFSIDVSAYGFASWKSKYDVYAKCDYQYYDHYFRESFLRMMRLFFQYPAIVYMCAKMINRKTNWGDVLRSMYNLTNGTYILRPSISLARNWGQDGSGQHSPVKKGENNLAISGEKHFELTDIENGITKEYRKRLRYVNLPEDNSLKAWYMMSRMLMVVLLYYFRVYKA